MKLRVTFKDPDALDSALNDCGYSEEVKKKFREMAAKWFEYGEYLTIEIDFVRGTCKVLTVEG
jgi:hypothetical protein